MIKVILMVKHRKIDPEHAGSDNLDTSTPFLRQLEIERQPTCSSWHLLAAMCAIVAVICAIDRAAMSVAILPMSEQYQWGDSVKGAVNR